MTRRNFFITTISSFFFGMVAPHLKLSAIVYPPLSHQIYYLLHKKTYVCELYMRCKEGTTKVATLDGGYKYVSGSDWVAPEYVNAESHQEAADLLLGVEGVDTEKTEIWKILERTMHKRYLKLLYPWMPWGWTNKIIDGYV